MGHAYLQQLLWVIWGGSWVPTAVAVDGSCLATAVAAGHMRWVMPTYSSCCGLYGVGHGYLQQLLQRYIGGSCLATAVAAEVYEWVMPSYSSCCRLYEVGHGCLQQLL
jgi:hypothetical protein